VIRTCLYCGFKFEGKICLKCDSGLSDQRKGQIYTLDIAHQGQTLDQAYGLAEKALMYAAVEGYVQVRLIVGNGLIGQMIGRFLEVKVLDQKIKQAKKDGKNQGAYLIHL
jgi:hypothetical protein